MHARPAFRRSVTLLLPAMIGLCLFVFLGAENRPWAALVASAQESKDSEAKQPEGSTPEDESKSKSAETEGAKSEVPAPEKEGASADQDEESVAQDKGSSKKKSDEKATRDDEAEDVGGNVADSKGSKTDKAKSDKKQKAATDVVAADANVREPSAPQGVPFWTLIGGLAIVVGIPVLLGPRLAKACRLPEATGRVIIVGIVSLGTIVICALGYKNVKLGIDLSGGSILVYQVEAGGQTYNIDELVRAVVKRVNPGGVKEVTVRPFGKDQIEVIIPEADPEEMRRIVDRISRTGALEFRIVAIRKYHEDMIEAAAQLELSEAELKDDEGEPIARFVPVADADQVARFLNDPERRGYLTRERRGKTEVLVSTDEQLVTGAYLSSASPSFDSQNGEPCVSFRFNAAGADLFYELTSANGPDPADGTRRELAIILDGQLFSAPTINEPIRENGQITGNFKREETEELAAVLTAGSLPASLRKEPVSSLTTGATLGKDTIEKGILAMAVSTAAVVAFMLLYYRFAGLVANIALVLNVLIILAFMIVFQGVFTLAGLAGLALTVGMAVDANVLIYERMREEINRGATLRMAIRNGFDRATTTIVDANVTTLITAAVLWYIGTDQVKGFAITLALGLVANLFTAITVSRLLFDLAERTRTISQLKFLQVLSNPNFDFIGKRRAAVVFSVLAIGAGLAGVVMRGRGLLDIDFTGGVSVEMLLKDSTPVGRIREELARVPELTDLTVQDVMITGEPEGVRYIINTSFQGDASRTNASGEPLGPEIQVEELLVKVFAGRLASNEVSFNPAQVREIVPEEAPALERRPSSSDKKEKTKDATSALPIDDARLIASAGQDALPSEAAPEGKAAKEQDETSAPEGETQSSGENKAKDGGETEKTGEKEPESADEKSAAAGDSSDAKKEEEKDKDKDDIVAPETKSPASSSRVTLGFSQNIDHDTLAARLAALAPQSNFTLANDDYESGSSKAYPTWTLTIDLPTAETEKVAQRLKDEMATQPYFPSSNAIGASVAASTCVQAIAALGISVALILAYVWFRFQQVSFGFAAVLAVVHDVLVALGGLALSLWLAEYLGFIQVQEFKISLPIVAAFLTIIGYSLNDTIVIFDRIREVRGKSPRITADLVNSCINQTLSRTILTSLTVFIVVLILYFFGGQGIHGFAFTLVVGVVSGTYSTVYIATPVLLWSSGKGVFDEQKGAAA